MVYKVKEFTAVLAVILLGLLSCCHCKREPECSQFNFLEQLLDKMVRTEVKFEEMQKQVDESLKQVQMALLSFDEANNKRDAEMSELMNAQVEKVNVALKELPQEDALFVPTIVFHAKDVEDTTVAQNEKYVFTDVIYNYGDGYDGTTGIFTAPVNGTYMFTLNLCVISGRNYVCYDIVVSDTSLARGVGYGEGGGHPCNAIDAIVVLEAGQEVWVESTCSSVLYSGSVHRWNSFAGALLHK